MAYKDLHETPFDETTIAKLEIFENYAQAWLPTFIMQNEPIICIFDFFSGTGYDLNGVPGSPIRLLEKIREQLPLLLLKKVRVELYLNEFEPNKKEQKKFLQLQSACNNFLETHADLKTAIGSIHYSNEDFEILFPKYIDKINRQPSLVYLDQNGIKFLSDKYLLAFEKMRKTDFLYFVSASYFWRFGDSKEFKDHLDIDLSTARQDPYRYIHRNVIAALKNRLPKNTKLKLYPFSLKKGANIHGIIFGATHPRAVDKFLSIAWRQNETNGEANFDIYEDASKGQLDIFQGKPLTRLENFKETLTQKILSGEIKNNVDALEFAYNEAHLGKHAAECLRELKKRHLISFEGISPMVTYENVYKDRKIIHYKIVSRETKQN